MSPGTTSAVLMRMTLSSRSTEVCGAVICAKRFDGRLGLGFLHIAEHSIDNQDQEMITMASNGSTSPPSAPGCALAFR